MKGKGNNLNNKERRGKGSGGNVSGKCGGEG